MVEVPVLQWEKAGRFYWANMASAKVGIVLCMRLTIVPRYSKQILLLMVII